MRLGFALPCFGENASPDTVAQVARQAEDLGFDSLWAIERTLFPMARRHAPASPEPAITPFDALTIAAASTRRIGLGVSMLNIPFCSPTALARSLGALSVASNGRARLGLGLGFSPEEFAIVGAALADRHSPGSEFLAALESICVEQPGGYQGEYFTVPGGAHCAPARLRPHPPIQLTAFAPAAVLRGPSLLHYHEPAMPVASEIAAIVNGMREVAIGVSENPMTMELVIRVNPRIGAPLPEGTRPLFAGSTEQVRSDIAAMRASGATKLILDLEGIPADQIIDQMRQAVDLLPSFATTRIAVAAS